MSDFIILADKRTGSSFLQECLNSHPNIKCWDEMFIINSNLEKRRGQYLYKYMKKRKGMDINKYLDFIFNENCEISTGFRLMYPQEDYFNVLKYITEKNISIIHLRRKNKFKLAMSKINKKVFEPKKVYHNPRLIINKIKKHEKEEKKIIDKIKNYENIININYEDMIGKTEGEKNNTEKFGAFNLVSDQITYLSENISKKICKFISVEERELFCNVTKKSSNNVWDYIKNKEKVKNELIKNGYENFILEE